MDKVVEVPDVGGAFSRLFKFGSTAISKTLNINQKDDGVIYIFALGALMAIGFVALSYFLTNYKANQIKLKQEALTAELRPILTCIDANDNDRLKLLASLEKVRRLATKHISSASLRTVFIKEDVHTQASELLKKKQDQPEVASAAMGVLAVVLKPSAKGAPPRDDVGQAAIQLILDNQDNRDVLINGLRLIVTVCIIQEAHESLFENDEIFKVLDLAFESKDRTAQEEACRTIQKVCSTASADTRGILLDHGYHVRVLLMLRELESPEALECALGALANLAHKNERNAELIDVGAIDGIHTIVNDNFDEQGVVMRGVGALLNLAVFGSDTKGNREALQEAHTGQLASSIMKKYKSDYMIQQRAMALRDLVKKGLFG